MASSRVESDASGLVIAEMLNEPAVELETRPAIPHQPSARDIQIGRGPGEPVEANALGWRQIARGRIADEPQGRTAFPGRERTACLG